MRPSLATPLLLAVAAVFVPGVAAARDGSVIVRCSPPGAEVVVDGAAVGEAPRTVALPAGKHTITLTLKGYLSDSQTVVIKPGQAAKLYVRLTRAGVDGLRVRDTLDGTPPPGLGMVVVVTEPAGLRVFVNGERLTRLTPVAFDVGPGTYTTTIKHEEVEVHSAQTIVKEGWKVDLRRDLRKAVATASARGDQGKPGDAAASERTRPRPCKCTPRKQLKACVEKRRACKLGAPDGERSAGYALCYGCPQFRRLPKKRRPDAETACDTRTGRADDCVCRDIGRVMAQCLGPQETCLRRCGGE